MLPINTIIVRN